MVLNNASCFKRLLIFALFVSNIISIGRVMTVKRTIWTDRQSRVVLKVCRPFGRHVEVYLIVIQRTTGRWRTPEGDLNATNLSVADESRHIFFAIALMDVKSVAMRQIYTPCWPLVLSRSYR